MSEAKQSPSRIFFEKKDEAFINKQNLKKPKATRSQSLKSSSKSKWNFDWEKRRRQAKQSQSRVLFEEKDEAFINKGNLKTQILSRIRRFTRRESIQLKAKFA